MKKMPVFIFGAAFLAASGLPAGAHEAHEHGAAAMYVSVEGGRVSIELESPLANMISFEHEPETDAQREEVRAMAAVLHRADSLFVFPAAAGCRQEEVALESEKLDAALLAPAPAPAHSRGEAAEGKHGEEEHDEEGHGEEEHGDLDAAFSFLCEHPAALRGMEVKLFSAFPALEEIEVQMGTPDGQHAAELTPGNAGIRW